MKKIGLTGTIASGKSEVEKILEDKYLVIDLDKVSHQLLKTAARDEILAQFKTIDRKELANIVFSNNEDKKKLEEILHPKLKEYVLKVFSETDRDVIVSGALLFEAGFFPLFDYRVFIQAPLETRLKRLIKRNSLTKQEALKRINSQSDKAKEHCEFVIDNQGSIEELKKKVKAIF